MSKMNLYRQQVAVAGLLIEDSKALIVRRSKHEKFLSGYYELPSGKVDLGEDPNDSIIREFYEETNLEVSVIAPYRVFQYFTKDETVQQIEIVYLLEIKGDTNNLKLSIEHDDFAWVGLAQFDKYKLSDEIKTNIKVGYKRYINQYRFSS